MSFDFEPFLYICSTETLISTKIVAQLFQNNIAANWTEFKLGLDLNDHQFHVPANFLASHIIVYRLTLLCPSVGPKKAVLDDRARRILLVQEFYATS